MINHYKPHISDTTKTYLSSGLDASWHRAFGFRDINIFQDHTELMPALVLRLKSNGFIAYVPAFDTKGPVYICDKDGHVQVRKQTHPHTHRLNRQASATPTALLPVPRVESSKELLCKTHPMQEAGVLVYEGVFAQKPLFEPSPGRLLR